MAPQLNLCNSTIPLRFYGKCAGVACRIPTYPLLHMATIQLAAESCLPSLARLGGGSMRVLRVLMAPTALIVCSLSLGSQTTPTGAHSMPPYKSTLRALVESAQAAHTVDGVNAYSKELVELLLPRNTKSGYIDTLSRRLASADLQARSGQHGYVAESSVAEAFNYLMATVEEGNSHPARTDTAIVHTLRKVLYDSSPALSSLGTHSDECLPSETVLLVSVLISNNGTDGSNSSDDDSVARKPGDVSGRVMHSNARSSLNRFMLSHSAITRQRIYDKLFRQLGF